MRNRQHRTVSLDNGQPIVFAGPPVVQDAAPPSKPPNAQLIPVRLDDPASAARTLRKHMTPDTLARLARLLAEEV